MPGVARELEELAIVTNFPDSSTAPFVGIVSEWSKGTESKRCASTKTFATMSPAPPGTGALWHPAQELASGDDNRSKLRGNNSGDDGSETGFPVPFASGRPWPSWMVQFAINNCFPNPSNVVSEIWNSWPSCKCCGI